MKAPTGKLAFAYRTIAALEVERDTLRAELEQARRTSGGVAGSAASALAAAAAQEPVEVYLALAEEEYEAPIVLRAFANKAEAEVFAQALRDYQRTRPEWPVGDAELEEVLERDKETRAWMGAHPGGEDAAWRRFFSVIAVPLSAAPPAADQPNSRTAPPPTAALAAEEPLSLQQPGHIRFTARHAASRLQHRQQPSRKVPLWCRASCQRTISNVGWRAVICAALAPVAMALCAGRALHIHRASRVRSALEEPA